MSRIESSPEHEYFCRLLIQARKDAGLTQVQLAQRLDRPQSFVSKYERGERRLDVFEFLEIARTIELDVPQFLEQLNQKLSQGVE